MLKTSKFILLLCLVVSLVGCKAIDKVRENYKKIRYTDGINFEEAKLIAQKHIMSSAYTQSYDWRYPFILMNQETEPYRNFWFVTFSSEDGMSTYKYVVVVDKSSGGVVRASSYQPGAQVGFQWLFK